MTRTMKQHEAKKSKILDAAWRLFGELGYTSTTVNVIIDEIGMAKGTFYHYFSSKQEVIDATITRQVNNYREAVEIALDDLALSAVEQLNLFLTTSWNWKQAEVESIHWLSSEKMDDGDLIFRHKLYEAIDAVTTEVLEGIVILGVKEGVFKTTSPARTSAMIVGSWGIITRTEDGSTASLGDIKQIRARIRKTHEFYLDSVERLLGIGKGTLKRPGRHYVATIANIYLSWSQNTGD